MRKIAVIVAMIFVSLSASAQMILGSFPDVYETHSYSISSGSGYIPSIEVSAALIGESDETDKMYLLVRINSVPFIDIPIGGVLLIRTTDGTVIDAANLPPREEICNASFSGAAFYPLTLEQFQAIGGGVKKLRMQYDGGVLELTYEDSHWGTLVRRFMSTVELAKKHRTAKKEAAEKQAYLNSLHDIREGF